MALVVEDGTGRADAQSYSTTTEIGDWASARGLTFSGSETVKEQNAQKAFDFLRNGRRFRQWRGKQLNAVQRGPYPRVGASLPDGTALADGVIPWQIKDAHAALTIMSSNGIALQTNLASGGAFLTSKTTGPISKSFAQPQGAAGGPFSLMAETIFTEVIGYLSPLLMLEVDSITPSYGGFESPAGYDSSSYENTES